MSKQREKLDQKETFPIAAITSIPDKPNTRPMKSSEWVLTDLKKQWTEGILQPGDKLASVEELAVQYSVGRSTIREALSALKMIGMLTMKQGGGTYVNPLPSSPLFEHPSNQDQASWLDRSDSLRQLLEVRRALETSCARLAAKYRTATDLEQLSMDLAQMEACLTLESQSEQIDVQYHLHIAQATQNPLFIELMTSLSEKLQQTMRDSRALWFYAEQSSSHRLWQEHQLIYLAIERQDAHEAAKQMEAHIYKVEQVLTEKGVM
jgi:GntR family transcriptional repressor for pyruvate dehydrogenase complex